MKRQSTLTSFFTAKVIKTSGTGTDEVSLNEQGVRPSSCALSSISREQEQEQVEIGNNSTATKTVSTNGRQGQEHASSSTPGIPSPASTFNDQQMENNILCENNYDIGKVVHLKSVSDLNHDDKYNYLKHTWSPPFGYNLPYSEHNKNDKVEKRYLGLNHINSFEWVAFSHIFQGLFCKYCVIFTPVKEKLGLKGLVTQPITKFAKLTGKDGILEAHNNNNYHKKAIISGQSFVKIYKNPVLDVRNEINLKRMEQIRENRGRLIPIIKTIKLLGRQNIPFRGHRDDGLLLQSSTLNESTTNEGSVTRNEGNFRELLKFRVDAGDKVLEDHLKTCNSKATFISKTVQNDLIECCGSVILDKIKERVYTSKFYSVLFDETTDLSHISQMSLAIRYIYNNHIYEDFLGFVNCHADAYSSDVDEIDNCEPVLTGRVLGSTVLKMLESIGLNPAFCVGIGTDGCEVMISEQVGAIQTIKSETLVAERCACFNHMLNLSISKTSQVQAVRNLVGNIKELAAFFNGSSKRHFVLKNVLKHNVQGLCETRWTERHDSVLQFKNDLQNIIEALDKISMWKESASSRKSCAFKTVILNCEFIVTLTCLSEVLSITQPLSVFFFRRKISTKSRPLIF